MSDEQPPRVERPSLPERAFPTIMRYCGLLMAMYEGFIDRPPQALVISLAAVMMAGGQALSTLVDRGRPQA